MLSLQKLVADLKQQGIETNNKINDVRDELNAKITRIASTAEPSSCPKELLPPSSLSESKGDSLSAPSTSHNTLPPNIEPSHPVEPSPVLQLPNNSVAFNASYSLNHNLHPLPNFDGKLEEWPLFYASYTDTTAEFNYNNKQNLIRLTKALHGNAKSAVMSLLIYPNNVPKVIEELRFNFGRPELLVRSQHENIAKIAAIPENRLESILFLSNQVRNMVSLFIASNCPHHLTNSTLLDQLVSKLPPSKQFEWAKYVVELTSFPTIETFSKWISDLAKVVCVMSTNATAVPHFSQQSSTQQRPAQSNRRVLHSNDVKPESNSSVCLCCQAVHRIHECQKFTSLSTDDKWKFVKTNRMCFGCLKKGHDLANCQYKQTCNVDNCKRKHHRLLHQGTTPSPSEPVPKPAAHVFSCRSRSRTSQLFKIVPVTLSGPMGSLNAYAMIDEGSSISLLEHHVALSLGLKGQATSLTLQWYGDETTTEQSCKTNLNIKGTFENAATFFMSNIYTVAELNLPTQSFNRECFDHFSSLGTYKEVVEAGSNQPIATKTKIGWVVFGPTTSTANRVPTVLHIREPQTLNDISQLVEEYFSIENFGVRVSEAVLESDDNRRAREILNTTTRRCGQRFETGLLWCEDEINLPSSYAMAKQRLLKIENKMSSDASYAECYRREINKYIEKGYAKLLMPHEAKNHGPRTWYLPHFGVLNPNKPGKLRIVFDAAATINSVSLNSKLLKGPEHAQPLINILYQFRQGAIAVAGDIQEMFSQVNIRQSDQSSQRFLWRDGNKNQPIRTYVMKAMIFGAICSPCSAEFIKNKNACEFESTMPRGAAAVIKKTYVDDFVISFPNTKEAEEVTMEAIEINAQAGFKLRSFVSNCNQLQMKLNKNEPASKTCIPMERQSQTDKILGLFWNVEKDTLEFHFKFYKVPRPVLEVQRPPTKRELLCLVMAIYDPFGLLANYTVFVKILLQTTWKRQISWDEPLPHNLFVQWSKWWREFQNVKQFAVARCYSTLLHTAEEVQLHVFVDASSSAYAAVCYIRVKRRDDIHVTLVAAKSRCAPKRGMTIPRLELQAAILGCRLSESIRQCLEYAINRIVFWCDSKTVISWVQSTIREYKQFVACRIAEILSTSLPNQWHWLSTKQNVADEATRPVLPKESSRWVNGPQFLHQSEELWPQETIEIESDDCDEELIQRVFLVNGEANFPVNYENFSSYFKLLRCIAWVLRFVKNCQLTKSKRQKENELTAEEIANAEKVLCRHLQQQEFCHEFVHLHRTGRVPKDSKLHKLNPYIAEDDILRVNGRIDAAYCLPLSGRQPIILPKEHHVTRLLVDSHHQRRHHQNDHLVINEIRQTFWIPSLRGVLKSVKRRCPSCIINRVKPSVPLMGQLPQDRLTPFVRPFTYTGVDYCGPFFVAIGRRREKRWVALFTCLTTRAVHLEIADELSTDAFLLCLRNFMNRRGTPIRIRSDNGTNFIGAQKELSPGSRLFDENEIKRNLARENIEWMFNCPANPNAGGCWERLVQCVKRLLARTLKDEAPRLETFRSVIIEAENIINNRPLTDLPISPDEDEPLTPNHFLMGCLNSTQTPVNDEPICLRKQWRISQNLKDRIWKRWIVEYLPQLLHRSKWNEKVKPLQVGQLVIICDHDVPRSQWIKGVVTKVYSGKDNQIRSAEVRTSRGQLRRPASKLAALVFNSESSPQ